MEKEIPQIKPQWVRRQWDAEAEAQIGDLIDFNKTEVMQDVAAGLAYLFQLIAENYAGWLLFSFKEIDGELICFVYCFRGEHCAAAFADLKKLAAAQGCKRIVGAGESAAHIRFYTRLGMEIKYCELSIDL